MESIGSRVQELRKRQGLNRPQLARAADVSYSFIVQVESGTRENPRTDKLDQVAKALGVSVDVLLATDQPLPQVTSTEVADLRRDLVARINALTEEQLRQAAEVLDETFGRRKAARKPTATRSAPSASRS